MLSKISDFPEKLLRERLQTDQRRHFVRAVVNEIRKTSKHLPKRQFAEIASQIVTLYPDNFEDRIEKLRVGTGYYSLLNQLTNRNDNLNRKYPLNARKALGADASKDNTKRKSVYSTDSYGCINWAPNLSEEEEEIQATLQLELKTIYGKPDWNHEIVYETMKKSFPLQRKHINEGKSLQDLKVDWPFLVEEKVIQDHCELLLGVNLKKAISDMYLKKGVRMLKFFQRHTDTHIQKVIQEVKLEEEMENVVALLPAVMLCLQAYLREKEESLFLIVDVSINYF